MSKTTPFRRVRPAPKIIVAVLCATFASGCATDPKTGQPSFKETFASDDPCSNSARNIGIVVGALAGAIIGNQTQHSDKARLLGAAGGAFIGGLIGHDMDRRRCELSKIAKQNGLDIQFENIKSSQVADASEGLTTSPQKTADASDQPVGLKVSLKDNGQQFKNGSDELLPEALIYFRQIANQYSYGQQKNQLPPTPTKQEVGAVEELKDKRILLIGHTDDTGSSALNAGLSERRAKAVAKVFNERGIPEAQLFFQGAGETLPIADNRTEDGRSRNRRVEIIDLTNDEALRGYLANRKPNLAYYRNTQPESAAGTGKQPPVIKAAEAHEPRKSRTHATGAGSIQAAAPGTSPAPTRSTSNALPASAPSSASAVTGKSAAIDFGGEPVGKKPIAVEIGKSSSPSGGFSIISAAHADEPMAGSCIQDRPRVSHGVKSLKDGKEFATRDYLPGLYDTSWAGTVNSHLVALTHVAVLRDGGAPARRPQLLIYRDYKGDAGVKPSYSTEPEINTYQGDKALLYRVFASGPVRCMDIVIPNGKPLEAPDSRLYYDRGQTLYSAAFNPKLAK